MFKLSLIILIFCGVINVMSMIEEKDSYRSEFNLIACNDIINKNNETIQEKKIDDKQSESHCHTIENDCTKSYCIALKNTKCLTINNTNSKSDSRFIAVDDFSRLPQNRPHYLCDISEKFHPNNFNENECCNLDLIEDLELIEDPVYY